MMAVHTLKGRTIVYRFRFGPLTPSWLDRAESRVARMLSRSLGRMGLLRRTYGDGA